MAGLKIENATDGRDNHKKLRDGNRNIHADRIHLAVREHRDCALMILAVQRPCVGSSSCSEGQAAIASKSRTRPANNEAMTTLLCALKWRFTIRKPIVFSKAPCLMQAILKTV